MDIKYFVALSNAQESFELVIIYLFFYNIPVNSQTTFLSANFCIY